MSDQWNKFEFLEDDFSESNIARKHQRLSLRVQADAFELEDQEFIRQYRLWKPLVQNLCEDLRPMFRETRRSSDISLETKVLTALSFYANGSYQRPIGNISAHAMAQQTVTACLNSPIMRRKYVVFPKTQQERSIIRADFYKKFIIPGVIGCIDCTQIAIIRPSSHEERYFCRKHYHSLNVQLICDANMEITSVDASYGSHDSFIWNSHPIKSYLESLNEPVWLLESRNAKNLVIVGDVWTMRYHSNGNRTFNDYFMMYIARWKRAAIVLLVVWIVVTYLVISPLRCNGNQDEEDVNEKLRKVTSQLETLRQQHSNLIAQIKRTSGLNGNLKDIDTGSLLLDLGQGPTEEYENLRRRIYSNTKELWYYINNELTTVLQNEVLRNDGLQAILDAVSERKSSLLSDQEQLSQLDGYHDWRIAEAANVSDLVQRRLRYLQNPPDCKEARKLICNLNKGCGFGCQLHHIVYCLIFAYATERTLILNSKGWRYNNKGWEYVFHPISDSCTSAYDDKVVQWPVTYDAKVVSLPFIDSISKKPKFLPLAVPKDLAHRIVRFNGDPASWWIGQILKYILKPKTAMQKTINETIAKLNFKSPIVGVHIRRTDKVGTEAAFHHIHEYMTHVKQFYDQLELTKRVDVRRVYLATDDASVLADARKKYPEYTFLGDANIARTAATHRRYSPLSLTGLLLDLHLLASSDYLVCTLSSQVGRVAYEIMQSNRVDASNSFYSLDDIYYFGGQNSHDRLAVMPNVAKTADVISFEVGDKIGIAGNHWNGFGRGTNKRTNMNGLIPWYKTADHLVLYPFPEYKQVPLYESRQKDL